MKFLFYFYFILFSTSLFAYPVFYGCKQSQMVYKNAFDDNDLFKKILLMDKGKRSDLINDWCQGSTDCLKDFEFIVKLSDTNIEIAKKLFEEELQKYKDHFSEKEISFLNVDEYSKLKENYSQIRACQETKSKLTPEDFISKGGGNILTPYPFYSNYMYATGCKGVDSENCSLISKSELDRVIEESVIMGVDPHLILSLSLMEGGTNEVGQLYLDPIGIMSAIGCSTQQVANGSNSDKALDSFGTSYIIGSDIKRSPALKTKLNNYFSELRLEKEKGQSYYCYDVKGKSEPSVFGQPQSNSCCLELGFKTSEKSSDQIKHALTYHYVDNITKAAHRGLSDPAWRLQRYNGYTDLMGGAEGVSPWRSGVNYYKNPAYGYQAMDFIVNALMFNPYISSKIEEASEKHHKKIESILCRDKPDGTYYLDSDLYFNKHKDSDRLEAIHQKFKQGLQFSALSSREKKVLISEMEDTASKNSKIPNRLTERKEDALRDELALALASTSPNSYTILNYTSLNLEAWKKRIQGKHSFTPSQLDIIYKWNSTDKKLSENYEALYKEQSKLSESLNGACQSEPNCWKEKEMIRDYLYSEDAKEKPTLSKESVLYIYVNQVQESKKKIAAINLKWKENSQKLPNFSNKGKDFDYVIRNMEQVEPLDIAIKRHEANPNYSPEIAEKMKMYYENLEEKDKKYDVNAAYKEYFKKVYSERSTLQKSSVYPWRRFNEEEVEKLVNKYRSYK